MYLHLFGIRRDCLLALLLLSSCLNMKAAVFSAPALTSSLDRHDRHGTLKQAFNCLQPLNRLAFARSSAQLLPTATLQHMRDTPISSSSLMRSQRLPRRQQHLRQRLHQRPGQPRGRQLQQPLHASWIPAAPWRRWCRPPCTARAAR